MDTQLATSIALCFTLPTDGSVPEWVQVIPAPGPDGRVQGEDGRWWTIKEPRQLATALNARARNIPFDINHATVLAAKEGRDSPSIGWPVPDSFEAREDGSIWARVAWEEIGRNAIAAKSYRFLSPALRYLADKTVVGLHSVSLTNHPNFAMPALNNRHDDPARTEQPNGAPSMKLIAKLLGLNAEASEDAIVEAIEAERSTHQVALNAAKEVDTSVYVPKAQHDELVATNAKLTEKLKAVNEKEIVDTVEAEVKAGKVAPAAKEHFLAMCRKEGGLEEFKALMAVSPVLGDPSGLDTKTNPATNSQQHKGKPTPEEVAVCEMTGRDPTSLYADA